MTIEAKILESVYNHFLNSEDFNGITISDIAKEVDISKRETIAILKELVLKGSISIQAGDNPFIIRYKHYDTESQIKHLDSVNPDTDDKRTRMAGEYQINITVVHECVYPSVSYLIENRNVTDLIFKPFSKRLALGEPHLTPVFFDLEVLNRYFYDPRYSFTFDDYYGSISIIETENEPSELNEHDQIFLQSFGLGYDESKTRVVVVYLTYLTNLSPEHQILWNSFLSTKKCKMVKEYFDNTMLGEWVDGYSYFSAFIEEQRIVNELCQIIFQKDLFRETFEEHKTPKEFTFFTSPTSSNYENFIALADKMISDNINKSFFDGQIETVQMIKLEEGIFEKRQKGTLALLDEWIRKVYKSTDDTVYADILKSFKQIRKERQSPAHKITDNIYDKAFYGKQMDVIKEAYKSMNILRSVLQTHPLAVDFQVPEWLVDKNIKSY